MTKKLIASIVAGLCATGSALAADDPLVIDATLGLGYRGADVNGDPRNGGYGLSSSTVAPFTGPRDEAKASEYRDLRNAPIGLVDVIGANRSWWFRGYGENFGLDDQYLNARGGGWGVWKAQVYNDRVPHNYSWNALTPFVGAGTSLQTASGAYPPNQNPALWYPFNYAIQRDNTGGNLELTFNSPWFVRGDYNEVKTTGVRPSGGQLGTGSGNGTLEFGMPVEYKTKNASFEAGYNGGSWNVKLGFLDSKFSDDFSAVRFTNFYLNNQLDTVYGPPDNELKKWSLNAMARNLPWDSTFTARATYSELTNNFDVIAGGPRPTSSASPPTASGTLITTPTSPQFNGEHKTTSVALALHTSPSREFEGRLYYNYYDKDNSSTQIGYLAGGLPVPNTCATGGASSATQFCVDPLAASGSFGYTKNEAGIEATWRFARQQKLMGGYSYLKVDRDLEYAMKTEDNKAWVEYRNSMLNNVGGRIKYTYSERQSDLDHAFTAGGTADPSKVAYYYTAYDVSNNRRNEVKANVDWTPMNYVSVSLGGTYRKTDYEDTAYGRKDDVKKTYDATVGFGDPDSVKVTLIGNWSEVKFDQAYHQGTGPLPGGVQKSDDFDWGTRNTQRNWLLGIVADWRVTERLSLSGSFSWQQSEGGVDFTSGNTAGAGGFQGGPLVNYVTDNTEWTRLNLKADYQINKNWSATLGYAYESYNYKDDQMRGYQGYYPYFQNLGGSNNSWLSGAFAQPGYNANIGYVMLTYRFQ